jgi:hypothetical protein
VTGARRGVFCDTIAGVLDAQQSVDFGSWLGPFMLNLAVRARK